MFNHDGIVNKIYDGSIMDSTNFESNQYLQINSCGYQFAKTQYSTIRQNGRRDYHILLIVKGKCKAEYDGKLYDLQKGNFVLYPPNVKQLYSFSEGCQSLWCHFTGNVIDEILNDCGLDYGVFFSMYDQRVIECYHNLIERFRKSNEGFLAKLSFMELLFYISPSCKSKENIGDKRINDVLNFINTNYANPINVESLAKISGYSKSHFNLIFKESVGCTPIQYLNDIRLSFALDLLNATTLSIGEIAVSCGFNDSLYFSRAFHKKYFCSPSEYRAISKKNNIQK